jgi:uncharacterized integral membrane protein
MTRQDGRLGRALRIVGMVALGILIPFALWQELTADLVAAATLPTRLPALVWAGLMAAFVTAAVIVVVIEGRQVQRLRQRELRPDDEPQ